MSNNRLAKLMGDIARERVRLKPVPRRGVGRFIADPDQFVDEPAMGSPPTMIGNYRFPPAPMPNSGPNRWHQTNLEVIKDFPEIEPAMETTIGGTNPGMTPFMPIGTPL